MPILPVVLVLLMIGGAADMASSAFRQSIMLAAANDEVRGRLQGVFLVVVAGGPRIADVAHGAAAASVGVAWATSMGGVGVVLATLVAAVLIPSFIRYRVGGFDDLDAPVLRVTNKDVPLPYANNLEKAALVKAADVVAAVKSIL